MRYDLKQEIQDRDGVTAYCQFAPSSGNDCWSALVGVIADWSCRGLIVIEYRAITDQLFECTIVPNIKASRRLTKQFEAYRSAPDCDTPDAGDRD